MLGDLGREHGRVPGTGAAFPWHCWSLQPACLSCFILASQGIHRLPDLLRFSLFLNTRQPLQ